MDTHQACREFVSEAQDELRKIFPHSFNAMLREGHNLAKSYCAKHSVRFVEQENKSLFKRNASGNINWVESVQNALKELKTLVQNFDTDKASRDAKLRIFSVANHIAFTTTVVEFLRHTQPKKKTMKETFDGFCGDAKAQKRDIDYVRTTNIIDAICDAIAKDIRYREIRDNDALNARAKALTELAEISICEAEEMQAYGGFASYLRECVLQRVKEGKVYGVRVDDGNLALA